MLILVVARYFANLGGRNLTWREIFKAFALVGVPMLLVLKQPDLGTTLTYAPILIAGLFLGGINLRQAAILITCGRRSGRRGLVERQASEALSEGPAHQLHQSRQRPAGRGLPGAAIADCRGFGRHLGQGPEKGTQTQGYFLPIPYTDFIFAAFSEEHGFVGAVFVLLLYFLILMRLIQNAQTAADLPGSLIIMGIVAVLTFQIAVNVGMVIGFMPVTGIPLPLMSYGGSSVLFTFLALGVAMNVRMRRFVN